MIAPFPSWWQRSDGKTLSVLWRGAHSFSDDFTWPNEPGTVNAGTALRFQFERLWPAVTDPER